MRGTEYAVVWPRGKRAAENVRFAKRLSTLEGKTVAFLWDWLFRGNEMYPFIQKELAKRYPGIKFVGYEVFGSTHGGEEAKNVPALPTKLKENRCDAVISGVGC